MPRIWRAARRIVNGVIALVQFPALLLTGAWLNSMGYDMWSIMWIGVLLLAVVVLFGLVLGLVLIKYSSWWRSIVLD